MEVLTLDLVLTSEHRPNMKHLIILIFGFSLLLFSSCASTTRLNFVCTDPTIDIYVDGEYVGRDLVNIAFPKSKRTVEVTCLDNGVEVLRRTFYVNSYRNNELIDLQVQRDLQYSSDRKKSKTR